MEKQTVKEKISDLQDKANSIKDIIQKAQRNKDQLEGEKKQLIARQSEITKKFQEEFGVNTIEELKKKVQDDVVALETMINEAASLIQGIEKDQNEQF